MLDQEQTCGLLDLPMAKNRAKETESTPPDPERRSTALAIKGTTAWREWVQEAAAFCRTDTSKLVDAAILEYVQRRGFKKEPPMR